jgi:spermidine synthase
MLHLWTVGFVSILGQTVLLRELNVAFYGIDLIYVLALGGWLLWSAAGSLWTRRKERPPEMLVRWLLLAFAIVLVLDVAFIRSIRMLFSSIPGAYLPFHHQILWMNVALLPVGLLSGMLFQKAAVRSLERQNSLAAAYGVESLGGLAGGLCATLALRWGMQNFAVAVGCSILAACVTLVPFRDSGARVLRAMSLAGTFSLAAILVYSTSLDRAMTSWTHPLMVETRDSPYSRVTVTRAGNQASIFENDALSFETEGTGTEEFVHLAALQLPNPRRVLLLGGGIEGGIREVLQHAPEKIDCVELNPVMVRVAQPYLSEDVRHSLNAPGVTITTADPRRFLATPNLYDLILVGMPEPSSGQANRYYTAEFFAECAARLVPKGVLAFGLPSAENLWTIHLTRRNAGIYRALKSAFEDAVVLPGARNIYLASGSRLARDPEPLVARLQERRLRTRLVSAPYIRYLYRNDRFAQVERALESSDAPVNTDEQPACYSYTVVLWLSKFFPGLGVMEFSDLWSAGSARGALWGAAIVLLAAFFICRTRPACRRAVLAGTAGFVGMVLETLLLLSYQTRSGILFQDLGILLMSFMGGLALGALAADRYVRLRAHGSSSQSAWGLALLAGLALLSLLTGYRVGGNAIHGIGETAGLLTAAGFLVSGVFAFAGIHGVPDQKAVIAPLYAADLMGGCLGCLAGTFLLVPAVGLSRTALLLAPLPILVMLMTPAPK